MLKIQENDRKQMINETENTGKTQRHSGHQASQTLT